MSIMKIACELYVVPSAIIIRLYTLMLSGEIRYIQGKSNAYLSIAIPNAMP